VSAVVNNSTDSNTKSTHQITGSESATIGGGFEIDLTTEVKTVFGKVSATLKTMFNRSTTSSTTTVNTFEIPIPAHQRGWIPAHQRGWLEGAPPMVHAEGSIIVYDGSRYFKLTNVFADLPSIVDPWM